MYETKDDLGSYKALLRGLAVPPHRLSVVLRYAFAGKVHVAEHELSRLHALRSQRSKFTQRHRIVSLLVRRHALVVTRPRRRGHEDNEQ